MMWAILLAKYWHYGAIVGLVVALAVMNSCYQGQIEDLNKDYQVAVSYGEAKAAQLNECNAAVDRQNAAIEMLEIAARERQEELDELLSKPPAVIYRDRIVEVPSIETGECEDVVPDIAGYIQGVLQ
jgi:hypothetical protein